MLYDNRIVSEVIWLLIFTTYVVAPRAPLEGLSERLRVAPSVFRDSLWRYVWRFNTELTLIGPQDPQVSPVRHRSTLGFE